MNVANLHNDSKAIIEIGQIDWTPVKMPLAIQGLKDKSVYKPYPNRYAIVHNRTGRPLDICSDMYRIHKPATLVSAVCESATEAGALITNISTWHGGASIAIEGTINAVAQFQGISGGTEARKEAWL